MRVCFLCNGMQGEDLYIFQSTYFHGVIYDVWLCAWLGFVFGFAFALRLLCLVFALFWHWLWSLLWLYFVSALALHSLDIGKFV